MIKNIDIPQYNHPDQIFKNEKKFSIKAIIRQEAFQYYCNQRKVYLFKIQFFIHLEKKDIFKKIKDLQINKATQDKISELN